MKKVVLIVLLMSAICFGAEGVAKQSWFAGIIATVVAGGGVLIGAISKFSPKVKKLVRLSAEVGIGIKRFYTVWKSRITGQLRADFVKDVVKPLDNLTNELGDTAKDLGLNSLSTWCTDLIELEKKAAKRHGRLK